MRKPSSSPVSKKTALIYVRVSTAGQAEDGVSLEMQASRCRAHAEMMGWDVPEIFIDEGISGKEGIHRRPGLARLVKEARSIEGAVVLVYNISRLSRSQRLLWHLLDEREGEGLSVVSVTEPFETATPMGKAMLGMIAVFSQLTADMIAANTRDALAQLKAQGVRLGQKPMNELLPKETLLEIKRMYTQDGFSQRAIVEELNRRNVPTARGRGKWGLDSVQRALKAPIPQAD
jgi:DNA invertase Pin-like site-specific DNA recombinase